MRSLIIGEVDTYADWGLVLSSKELSPPPPKVYEVDVPGGNGSINLTAALSGDTAYGNRKQKFTFSSALGNIDFEQLKTTVSNALHGREFDYSLSWEPGYIYHGWFSIDEYATDASVGRITVSVDAEPFKRKPLQTKRCDASGGAIVRCESGRMRVRPTIETGGPLRVIAGGKEIWLSQGAWEIEDVLFGQGVNELYLCSLDIRNLTWGNLKENGVTWADFRGKRLFEWYKSNGNGTYAYKTWADVSNLTWGDLSETTWAEHLYKLTDAETVEDVFISYEWGDL